MSKKSLNLFVAKSMKNDIRKYSDFEYEALIKHYQDEIKKLLAQKNETISCLTR